MEFKKVNEEIERLSLLEKNELITIYGSDLIVELKTLLQQRTEMLDMLEKVCKKLSGNGFPMLQTEIEQLIKKATEL